MQVESNGTVGVSLRTLRQQQDHQVQDVFSAILASVGREGYASADAVTSDEPQSEQIATSWSDWFDLERCGGRYAQADDAEALEQSYSDILVRAYNEGGYATPKSFLDGLSKEDLAVIQHVQSLADPIQVDSLSEEGALNLLIPPAAQVDVNHDGLTQSGAAYGLRFPDSTTPDEVVQAWESATAGMSFGQMAIYQLQMKMPLLTANLVCDANGQLVHRYDPGDAGFRNPMDSGSYSYVQAVQDSLDYLEAFRAQMPVEQYERDTAFWTRFQQALIENGAT